jgi:DNA replication protein DnaC
MDKHPGLLVLTGIQNDHYKSLLDNFTDRYEGTFYKELMDLADIVINDKLDKRFVFLTGNPGSGKSHFLVGLFRSKVMHDQGVMGTDHSLYLPFSTLITEIISSFSDTPSTRTSLAKYLQVKYLFIDDISRGERVINPDKIEAQVFHDILLDRYEREKFLICTSNYTKVEMLRMLKSIFGDYTHSRVISSSIFMEFPNGDFRRTEKK